MTEHYEQSVDLYSNQARVHLNPFDIAIDFGLLAPGAEDPSTMAVVARVRVSPQMAKALSLLLSQIVATYETNIGLIPGILAGNDEAQSDGEDHNDSPPDA